MTLTKNKITIMDGGMGRQLEKMGAPFRLPEWSALAVIEAPEFVTKAHQSFIDAGAEIIITNTYSLVPLDLGQDRFDEDGLMLIARAAKIAHDVAKKSDKDILVAGSIPPAFGSYRPDLFIAEKADAIFTTQIIGQEKYIDFWLAETVSSIEEAKTIARLVKQHRKKPLWISFSLKDREDENIPSQLRSGEPVREAVQIAADLGAQTILFNCSQAEEMSPALDIVQDMKLDIPYGVYANAFSAIKEDKVVHDGLCTIRQDISPTEYLKLAQEWQARGASIIGGCCGIGQEHIQALSVLNEEI